MNDDSLVLTVDETAKLLRISRGFAYELVHQKVIPSLRLGRRIVVPRRALEAALADQSLLVSDEETA